MPRRALASLATLAALSGPAGADVTVTMNAAGADGPGAQMGTITLHEVNAGTMIHPDLKGVPAGVHGFHLHENGSCLPANKGGEVIPAGEAGDHYDPHEAGAHAGPYDEGGHRGDLPALYATDQGEVTVPVLAPYIKLADFAGRALVLHAGADTYSDTPKLGGGGARLACGVVPNGRKNERELPSPD